MAPTLRQVAKDYLSKGLSVIPVSRSSKLPLVKWREYQNHLATETEIDAWFDENHDPNIGLVTGSVSGVLVVDCDNKEAEQSFLNRYPEAREAHQVKTPRGRHFYFAHRPGIRNSSGKLGPGIDVRGEGGYALLPPSTNGERGYEWMTKPDFKTWTPLPRELAEELTRPDSDRIEGGDGAAITNGQRNHFLTRMAGSMRHWGASADSIYAALVSENAARCEPPLDDVEVRRIAESIGRYQPDVSFATSNPLGFHIYHGPKVSQEPPPELDFLLRPLIPASGITLLHGKTSIGKSALLWALLNELESGESLLDPDVKQTRCLLVSLDMSDVLMRTRWFGSKDKPKAPEDRFEPLFDYVAPSNFHILEPGFIQHQGKGFKKLIAPYGLVVFDCLSEMVPDLFDPTTVSRTKHVLRELMGDKPAIIVHHDRKQRVDAQGKPLPASSEDASGSNRWRDLSAHEVHVYRENQYGTCIGIGKSQIHPPLEKPIRVAVDHAGRLVLAGEAANQAKRDALTKALASLPPTVTSLSEADEWVGRQLGKSARTVREWRQKLGLGVPLGKLHLVAKKVLARGPENPPANEKVA